MRVGALRKQVYVLGATVDIAAPDEEQRRSLENEPVGNR